MDSTEAGILAASDAENGRPHAVVRHPRQRFAVPRKGRESIFGACVGDEPLPDDITGNDGRDRTYPGEAGRGDDRELRALGDAPQTYALGVDPVLLHQPVMRVLQPIHRDADETGRQAGHFLAGPVVGGVVGQSQHRVALRSQARRNQICGIGASFRAAQHDDRRTRVGIAPGGTIQARPRESLDIGPFDPGQHRMQAARAACHHRPVHLRLEANRIRGNINLSSGRRRHRPEQPAGIDPDVTAGNRCQCRWIHPAVGVRAERGRCAKRNVPGPGSGTNRDQFNLRSRRDPLQRGRDAVARKNVLFRPFEVLRGRRAR